MEPIAVISDIHGNLEALQAVLEDISARGVNKIICLGDTIGYGPDPCQCLDLIQSKCQITLMGNHDFAVMYEPTNFNLGAENACFWTRRLLEEEQDAQLRRQRWEFLGLLPVKAELPEDQSPIGKVVFAHGSPRRPISEYVFPDDVYNSPAKIQSLFDRFERACLIGHVHIPGVFLSTPDFYSPDELDNVYEMDRLKVLINVGSVGQPRDGDPRASYVILEEGLVRFVRVEYDVEKTIEKIHAIKELEDYLGNRLREGK